MSVFLEKGRGWKYHFVRRGKRYYSPYFKTKSEAKRAEAQRKGELENPWLRETTGTRTGTVFFDLINRRLDHVQAYSSATYYRDYMYMAKRWIREWGGLSCEEINQSMVESYFLKRRKKVSGYTVNQEIKYLKASFNWALKKGLVDLNPVAGIEFMPAEVKAKYIPPLEDIERVMALAEGDMRDYLWIIRDTMARKTEIHNLTWDDVNFQERCVTLYTRKKRGGHLTPRQVPMTERVYTILSRRFNARDKSKPWVFWHTYVSRITGEEITGPYGDRRRALQTLCRQAGVKSFGMHALRHLGASLMERQNVSISSIQRILGHEKRKTTEIYLHSVGQAERNAMQVYEQASKKLLSDLLSTKKKGLRLVS